MKRVLERRKYPCWVHISPSSTIDGLWVAHCLELDVVSQGSSPTDALEMVGEASAMLLIDDLNEELDPLDRRAPEECWDHLFAIFKEGDKVDATGLAEVDAPRFEYAIQIQLTTEKIEADHGHEHASVPVYLLIQRAARDVHC